MDPEFLADCLLCERGESHDELKQLVQDWPLCKHFDLPLNPTIVVVGAYKGRAMDLLGHMFPQYDKIVGFEPQIWAAAEAGERVGNRRDMWIHGVGLGAETRLNVPMGEWHTDAASFVATGAGTREQGEGVIMEADAGLKMAGLDADKPIDLMVMNIEGGEYDLIPQLQKTGWLRRIDRLAVQWHLYGDTAVAEKTMDNGISALHAYYDLEIDDRPTWTYFTKRAVL
jgi:hypothetical protein